MSTWVRRALVLAVGGSVLASVAWVGVTTRGAEPRTEVQRVGASPSADAPRARWSTTVPGWVNGLAADDRDVAVVAGGRVVEVLAESTGTARWSVTVDGPRRSRIRPGALDGRSGPRRGRRHGRARRFGGHVLVADALAPIAVFAADRGRREVAPAVAGVVGAMVPGPHGVVIGTRLGGPGTVAEWIWPPP